MNSLLKKLWIGFVAAWMLCPTHVARASAIYSVSLGTNYDGTVVDLTGATPLDTGSLTFLHPGSTLSGQAIAGPNGLGTFNSASDVGSLFDSNIGTTVLVLIGD